MARLQSIYMNRGYSQEEGCDVQVGVDPKNCVVVEDAAAGVQAARLAGEPLIADQLQEACAAVRASCVRLWLGPEGYNQASQRRSGLGPEQTVKQYVKSCMHHMTQGGVLSTTVKSPHHASGFYAKVQRILILMTLAMQACA